MGTYTAEQLIAIGGSSWTGRNGAQRVYLNDEIWGELAGLHVERYKTGNIAAATLDGKAISNRKGSLYSAGKVFLDVASGRLCTQYTHEVMTERIIEGVARAVAALTPAPRELTTREAAAELGVSVRTVQRRAAAGLLGATKINRRWVITL